MLDRNRTRMPEVSLMHRTTCDIQWTAHIACPNRRRVSLRMILPVEAEPSLRDTPVRSVPRSISNEWGTSVLTEGLQ